MHGDDITVLDTEIVAHNTVDAGTAIIQIIIGQDDQYCVLALLSLDQHRVTPEELKGFHGIVRKSDYRVVIVHSIRHTVDELSASTERPERESPLHPTKSLTSMSWASSFS